MSDYLTETRKMTKEKKYAEALERFIWFHENGPVPTRNSFALMYWKELADDYPPALVALKNTRDTAYSNALKDSLDADYFSEVVALNREFGDTIESIKLFELIAYKHPKSAIHCWYYIKDELFKAKRYDLIKRYLGDPLAEYNELASIHKDNRSFLKKQRGKFSKLIADEDKDFIEKCVGLVNYCKFLTDTFSANKIWSKARQVFNDDMMSN